MVKIACQYGRSERCRLDPWVGKILWIRKWQPTPVFLPGKFHGQKHLEGCSPWGHKQSNMTELLSGHTHPEGKLSLCSPNSPIPFSQTQVWSISLPFSSDPFCSPLILSTITSDLDAHNPQRVSLPPSLSPNLSSLISLGIFLNCESDYFTLLI